MPSDYEPQDYFPSSKCRISVRIDEFGKKTRLLPAATPTTKNLNGISVARGQLKTVPDPLQQGKFLLVPDGTVTTANVSPQSQGSSTDGLTFDFELIPREADWNQNGPRQADQCTLALRWVDCPIDPRVIRSAAVELFLGVATEDNFVLGVGGLKRGNGIEGTGQSLSLIDDQRVTPDGRLVSNSRFKGFVDMWEVEWPDKGEPTIKLSCRDNTCLLINQMVSPKIVLDMNKPIDQAVAQFLANYPQMAGLSVQYLPEGDTPPSLKGVLQGTAYRPRLGPHVSKGGGGGDSLNVWDYLTDVCGAMGLQIRLDGLTIIIQAVRAFTTSAIVRRTDDPFQGRVLKTGQKLDYRTFIYGRNISDMKVKRDYTKHAATNIEVRSYNTHTKQVLVVRFPELADRKVFALPGNAKPEQKWRVVKVPGILDKTVLKRIAQSLYEDINRTEMHIEVKTKNLASFGGGNTDPDILDMKAGDTFELLVNRGEDEINTLNTIEKGLSSARLNSEFLRKLGYSPEFADAYAKAYTDAGFLTQFRVRAMKVSWSNDEGVSFHIQGVNYVEVRMDASSSDTEPGTTASLTTNTKVSPF